MSTAIEFENISKQYRLGLVSTGTLSHDLNRFWQTKILRREDPYLKVGETNDRASKGSSDYVWALKDINFKVEQGDVVGIIGRNGAGKSTLLKLLSRVTAPTTGIIRAKGRIASLLEVGTGFHPEMTGRENIYMNGAIMGMTRAEISRKLDEIVDFSGCERYLDTPVKRYSSGMTVRLGFAIAAHLEPEILVVDEVLAVGDAEFQKKAIGKMQDVSKGEGRTVLFVSHNMGAVRNLCKTGIVLNQGQVAFTGSAEESIGYYINKNAVAKVWKKQICDINHLNPTKDVQFLSIKFSKHDNEFASDEPIEILFDVFGNKSVDACRINLTIHSVDGTPIGSVSNVETFKIEKREQKTVSVSLKELRLVPGIYSISFATGIGNYLSCQRDFDVVPQVLSFSITSLSSTSTAGISQWNRNWGNIIWQGCTTIRDFK
ncbi:MULTISPECIES: polysaccharide ABC transporter ATP-binding protein [unclassified Fibrobacter]|uniref:ABC transporter ATP-binding protein n=1 Tax=unclassified Fibrobacter TaxID=2634177 RepID=UPI000D6C7027|nr:MULTISPECIES: polysaccharide ABC transporter ATP-binding protein [unclassified Fibrobacter]PWJ63060.1 ABC-type polysaccharide/polyol phosphate transport system ATPase subunit [Fibrobacter sp. UWR4]PZW68231.1 ABC-type polysaccharide/polyol phosphate transport system ATPase subunit [Fibrobacter sp. UWR1]